MSNEKAKKKTTKKETKSTKKTTGKKSAAKKPVVENVVSEGSLLYVDYTIKTKRDGKVFDCTMEDVAREEGMYKEDERYEPMLVGIGWNWLLAAVEEELIGMRVGESKTVEVPPEKGSGLRDPSKIKLFAKIKLAKHGVRAIKGEEVKIGHERGVITQVLGRRVRVDFNSPLAGKTLVFDITARELITDPEKKVLAVIKRRIPAVPVDQFGVSIKGKTVTIEFPQASRYIEGIQYAEIGVASDALKVIEKAKKIKFVVTYERPEPPKEAGN